MHVVKIVVNIVVKIKYSIDVNINVILDLCCGEVINTDFSDSSSRNLDLFFKRAKEEEIEDFIEKVEDLVKNYSKVAIPGYLLELLGKRKNELMDILEKVKEVLPSPYYHEGIFNVESIKKSLHALKMDNYSGVFLPSYEYQRGNILENNTYKPVKVFSVSPFQKEFQIEHTNVKKILEVLKKVEPYSKYRKDVYLRFYNTEFVFSASNNFEKFIEIISCYQRKSARWMKSRLSAMSMRFLPTKLGFHFSFATARSLEEFYELLKKVDEREFYEYIERGDIARWINDVIKDKLLSKEISKCKSREEILKKLKTRIENHRKKLLS